MTDETVPFESNYGAASSCHRSTGSLDHKGLVRRVAAWLRSAKNCPIVLAELATRNSETPDAIGFYGGSGSVLIECKVSRADFLADRQKWFRQSEDGGMGDFRYFATPPGLLTDADLPEGWGLIEVHPQRIRVVRDSVGKEANKRAEMTMLFSVIRRLEISSAVFVQREEENSAYPDNPSA